MARCGISSEAILVLGGARPGTGQGNRQTHACMGGGKRVENPRNGEEGWGVSVGVGHSSKVDKPALCLWKTKSTVV